MLLDHEREVARVGRIEGLVLRYGQFYGPGTYLRPRRAHRQRGAPRRFPIVGPGTGIFSFIHVEDAAAATVAALDHGAPGIYNVDRRRAGAGARVAAGLRGGARRQAAAPGAGLARPARRRQVAVANSAVGLRGASNAKAKRELGWEPRYPSWRQGFREALG